MPSKKQPHPGVTPAAAWGQPEELPLPTGHTVLIRPSISLMALATGGAFIPNPLSESVLRLVLEEDRDLLGDSPPDDEARRHARFRDHRGGMLAIVAFLLVSPKVVLDREPDRAANEIAGYELHDSELWALYAAAQGGPQALASFRNARDAAATGPTSPALRDDAEPVAQD